tara:strand:+ start:2436 stop:3581 length:1146 start_codon:yes stop_codon:yes gene_type:complete
MAVEITETLRHNLAVTEDNWQLTLTSGPTGPAGADGTNGTNGTNGADGADGAAGPNVITSSTSSNGTANINISNVVSDTAEVQSLLTISGDQLVEDSSQIAFGAGEDLKIYHASNNSYIKESGTGGLFIQGDTTITIEKTDGENMAEFIPDGAIKLYYNNAEKLQTSATGVNIFGEIIAAGDVDLQDTLGVNSGKVKIGAGDDLQLYHDGTNSFIANSTGTLNIQGNTAFSGFISLPDGDSSGGMLRFGNGNDLQIYHNGSDSYIDDAGTGNLNIRGANLNLQKYTGETFIACVADGSINIYHDNVAVVTTLANGVNFSGVIQHTAYPFSILSSISPVAAGMRAFVTDSNQSLSSHHGDIVAGGGSNYVPVYYDGSNWRIG